MFFLLWVYKDPTYEYFSESFKANPIFLRLEDLPRAVAPPPETPKSLGFRV